VESFLSKGDVETGSAASAAFNPADGTTVPVTDPLGELIILSTHALLVVAELQYVYCPEIVPAFTFIKKLSVYPDE